MSNMDMPPPARSSMQRTSKIESKTVKDLNDRDMAQKVEMLKDINIEHGNETSEINTAMDGRYNSATTARGKKPGQNASQAIGLHVKLWQTKSLWFRPASKISCVGLELGSREKELICSVPVDIQSVQLICPCFNLSQSMTWDMI